MHSRSLIILSLSLNCDRSTGLKAMTSVSSWRLVSWLDWWNANQQIASSVVGRQITCPQPFCWRTLPANFVGVLSGPSLVLWCSFIVKAANQQLRSLLIIADQCAPTLFFGLRVVVLTFLMLSNLSFSLNNKLVLPLGSACNDLYSEISVSTSVLGEELIIHYGVRNGLFEMATEKSCQNQDWSNQRFVSRHISSVSERFSSARLLHQETQVKSKTLWNSIAHHVELNRCQSSEWWIIFCMNTIAQWRQLTTDVCIVHASRCCCCETAPNACFWDC